MTLQYNDLPNFGDNYLQFFDPETKSFHLRRKSRNNSGVSIYECMELVSAILKRYQMSFVPNKVEKTLILFPFLFNEPSEGDKIKNITTGEIYTVDQIIKNPSTGKWAGLVKFDLVSPPSIENRHKLEYLDFNKYIKFDHEMPANLTNLVDANSERMKNSPPMQPTITWSLKVVEPGSFGKPFSSDKQLKAQLRESTKDPYVPGYTVDVWGQWFDNIVQFTSWSHDPRTSEKLISWFDQFLKLYTDVLRYHGIVNMFFWKREQDSLSTTWRQSFYTRDTQWYFRTEELQAVYQRDILKIDISLESNTTINPLINNETRYIADQKVSGLLTPDQYRNLFYRSGEYLFGELDIRQ